MTRGMTDQSDDLTAGIFGDFKYLHTQPEPKEIQAVA